MTSRSAASRALSGPAKWPSERKLCGWTASSQSPRVPAIADTASAASGFNGQLGATTAIFIRIPYLSWRRSRNRATAMIDSPIFFSGIGGSGMLPLARIVRASGGRVAGSDRSLDAGRTQPKFDYLRSLGIQLFAQDGSGLQPGMTLVTSAAVEDTVPDVVRARELGLDHLTRPQFLAQLLNAAQRSVAVGGTSGKSTVTGMIGWILHANHRQPTVMNGAVMKNFVTPSAPFASALVGDPELFVSEVDESDGSISLYRPEVAVLTNISLDHKEMDELRTLFAGFLNSARKAVLNLDDPETRALSETVPG